MTLADWQILILLLLSFASFGGMVYLCSVIERRYAEKDRDDKMEDDWFDPT